MLKKLYKRTFPLRFRIEVRQRIVSLRQWQYRGAAVECLCCGRQFSAFAPFGIHRRKAAACPNCDAMERHRFLWYWLTRHTDLTTTPAALLHFAPEFVLERKFRALPQLDYVTADIAPEWCDITADICDLPIADERFDWIICAHVLGYIDDEHAALAELKRVLKRGGKALILERIDSRCASSVSIAHLTPEEKAAQYGVDPYVMQLRGRDYAQELATAGFEVTTVRPLDVVSEDAAQRYGFVSSEPHYEGETIYVCTRK